MILACCDELPLSLPNTPLVITICKFAIKTCVILILLGEAERLQCVSTPKLCNIALALGGKLELKISMRQARCPKPQKYASGLGPEQHIRISC